MSRSLPLGVAPILARNVAGTVEVYDPAMCCPTGVCGPGLDPALLEIARDLRWIQSQGVDVSRRGLAQEPEAFASHPRVAGLMAAFGDSALPATLVNGSILIHGRYPTREELLIALAQKDGAQSESAPADTSGCCTPGSGCC
jgi:hypothetical protein